MAEAQVEYLAPEDTPEDQEVSLAPLNFQEPLEKFKNLFDRMADLRAKVILWESKTKIVDAKSRDEAIRLRTTVTRTAKAIEDAYLKLTEPARDYMKEVRAYATAAQVALIGSKDNAALGVAGRLTTKISDYAAECKRKEEEEKAKVLAAEKAAREKIEAERREREAQEKKRQEEEAARLEQVRLKALEEAKAAAQPTPEELAEGEVPSTDVEDHVLQAMEEEQARIDQERAAREKVEADRKAEEERQLDEENRKAAVGMARATGMGKVKGVKTVWAIELVNEELLDKKFMVFDPSKARKYLEGGFYNKNEQDPLKIIPGLSCLQVLGKGGK